MQSLASHLHSRLPQQPPVSAAQFAAGSVELEGLKESIRGLVRDIMGREPSDQEPLMEVGYSMVNSIT